MRLARFLGAVTALFLFALGWNGLVHLVLLRSMESGIAPLRRPDFNHMLWLGLLLTLAVAVLFVWGYRRFARNSSLREAALFGLYFGLTAGVLVDFNQYLLYPIPGTLALLWFGAGLMEFVIYGLLLTRIFPVIREH